MGRKSISINSIIDGLLLTIVTINSLFNCLPPYIAIPLEILILSKLIYEYFPKFTKNLYQTPKGVFTEHRWVILVMLVAFAIPGYITSYTLYQSTNITMYRFIIISYLLLTLLLSFPLAYAWQKENKGIPPVKQSFWRVSTKKQGINVNKEWEKSKKSLLFPFYILGWYYVPGLFLSVIGFGLYSVCFLFSLYSQLFALLTILWVFSSRFFKRSAFKDKGQEIEKRLLNNLLLFLRGFKGGFGFICIFTGLLFPGMIILYELPFLFTNVFNSQLLTNIFQMLSAFFLLTPAIYQFAFWYAILRRFPYFMAFWQNGSKRKATFSLPTGDIYGFLGSVIWIYCYTYSMLSGYSDLLLIPWFLFGGFIINLVFVIFIVKTIIEWKDVKEPYHDVSKDNFRIPLAILIQFGCFSTVNLFIGNSILNEEAIVSLLIGSLLVAGFFTDDWKKYVKKKINNTALSDILRYFPGYVILLIANFIVLSFPGPLTYIVPSLSIILFFLSIISCREFINILLKRSINSIIDGLLLTIVTINSLVNYLPIYIAIPIEILTISKLIYEYFPKLTKNFYQTPKGIFTEHRWVRILMLSFAIFGYLFTYLTHIITYSLSHILQYMTLLAILFLLLSFFLAYAWQKENKNIPPIEQSFLKAFAKKQGRNLVEDWEEFKKLQNKLIKLLYLFVWYYLPGLFLSGMCVLLFFTTVLFFLYSQLFALLTILWVLGKLFKKSTFKNKSKR